MATLRGSYSSKLANECLQLQRSIALKVLSSLNCGRVYVFDTRGYFKDAVSKVTADGFRYLIADGNIGVLSAAAQNVLPCDDPNVYSQIAGRKFSSDSIGLYITP